MFLAHLPGGYLLTRSLCRCFSHGRVRVRKPRALLGLGLLCSVLPDFDLAYSFLFDHGRLHHHCYVTHWPLFWAALFGIAAVGSIVARRFPYVWPALIVAASNVFLHLFLDWIVSAIWVFAPFSDRSYNLVVVPARYHPWYLNFLFYWTFWLDTGIAVWGTVVFLRDYPWRPLRGAVR